MRRAGKQQGFTQQGLTQQGFTLIEIMIVVAIMGILAATAVYNQSKTQKRIKRLEVTMALEKLKEAQALHYIEFGTYATSFDDLVFKLAGGTGIGCPAVIGGASANRQCYQGSIYQYVLSNPTAWGGDKSYSVSATGNIDGDAFLDIWILETGRYN